MSRRGRCPGVPFAAPRPEAQTPDRPAQLPTCPLPPLSHVILVALRPGPQRGGMEPRGVGQQHGVVVVRLGSLWRQRLVERRRRRAEQQRELAERLGEQRRRREPGRAERISKQRWRREPRRAERLREQQRRRQPHPQPRRRQTTAGG